MRSLNLAEPKVDIEILRVEWVLRYEITRMSWLTGILRLFAKVRILYALISLNLSSNPMVKILSVSFLPELMTHVLSFLNAQSLVQAELVSHEWHRIASSRHAWKQVYQAESQGTEPWISGGAGSATTWSRTGRACGRRARH